MAIVGTIDSATFGRLPLQRMPRISPFTPITPVVIREFIGTAGLNCGDPKYVFKEGAFIWADTPLQKGLIKLTLKARLNTTRFSQCHANSAP